MTKLLIDGNHLAGRCWATCKDLVTSKGEHSGLIHGFIRGFLWAKGEVEVNYPDIVVCWDFGRAEFRTTLYPEYKGNREPKEPTQEELTLKEAYKKQLNALHSGLENFGCQQVRVPGVEADDLLGIFSSFYKENLHEDVVIYSGDHDMHQLVGDGIRIFDASKGFLSTEDILKLWELPSVDLIPYYKAVVGDRSDNISGVKGIGHKRAISILRYLRIGSDGSLSWDPSHSSDKSALKWIHEFNSHSDIIQRNVRLMKIPRSWEQSCYTPHQMLEAFEQLLNRGRVSDDLGLIKFFRVWELEQLSTSYRGF